MNIDILICTYNNGINNIEKILMSPHPQIRYKVSHQITDSKYANIPIYLQVRDDVKVSQINSRGLSNNRNNCLSIAEEEICLIADDDVKYNINEVLNIIDLFIKNEDIDLITGKIRTYEGEKEYKKYSNRSHVIEKRQIGSISSIEMAFRRKAIINPNIQFDNRFGLGGELFKKGEEAAFLSDCLKANLRLYYFPVYFVQHPKESSGSAAPYTAHEAQYMGALCWRLFKNLAYVFSIVFMIKHHNRYRTHINRLNFLNNFFKGIKIIKSHKKI